VNIYELLRLMIKAIGDLPNKDQAFALINDLEAVNAFGSMGLIQGDGKKHECVLQEELYTDGIRHILRCVICRKDLSSAFFPPSPGSYGKRW
jgi:hypothetical protein